MTHSLLYLVRHGAVTQNMAGQYVGHINPELSDKGRLQAGWTAQQLAECECDVVYCSPLLRARHTAEKIATALKVPVETDPDLMEIHFGRWEGKTFSQVATEDPALVSQWQTDPQDFRFPDGESMAEFRLRMNRVAATLRQRMDAGNLCAVSHGGVIKYLICLYAGIDLSSFQAFHLAPGAFATLDLSGKLGVLRELRQPG